MFRFAFALAMVGAVASAAPVSAATFLFIRHAESKTNAGTATPGELVDPPLTALGDRQALALADALDGVDLSAIFVSSYKRTADTIAPTAARKGLTPTVVPAIREWSFGDGPIDLLGIRTMFGAWLSGDTAARIAGVPTSESLDELRARVVPAYRRIIADHADDAGVVAIVGHGGSIGWVMPYLAENVPLSYALTHTLRNTGTVSVALHGGKPYVTSWDGAAFDWPGKVAPVPLPASGLLLGGAGALLAGTARRKRTA